MSKKKNLPAEDPVEEVKNTTNKNDAKQYMVTELAGQRVAGKRVKAGEPIELTDDEARSERIMGTIETPEEYEKKKSKASPKTETSKAETNEE